MTLAILTSRSYKKENYKLRLNKIVNEKIKYYNPTKILVNNWDELYYIEGDKSKIEIVTNESLNKCELIMIIRCSLSKCNDLESMVKNLDIEKLTIKNYMI